MKFLRHTSLLLALIFALACATLAGAQPLPVLDVAPRILAANGTVHLSLPAAQNLRQARVRVEIFEKGRPALLGAVLRDFAQVEGRWQAEVKLDAPPGAYEFRLTTVEKKPIRLTADSDSDDLTVAGIERGAGWWLFNGLPWAEGSETPDMPQFIPGLLRDFGRKAKTPAMTARVANGSLLNWQTVKLPPLRNLTKPGADWTQIVAIVQNAQQDGKRGLLGFVLPAGDGGILENVAETMRKLREVVALAAPGAALILRVDAAKSPAQAARDIDSAAAFFDAVVLAVDGSPASLWPVKAARRTAEDQPFFDLPIFVELPNSPQPITDFDYHLAGATGFTKPPSADYQRLWQRNAALFIGAVTLEDAGLPLPLDGIGTVEDESPLVLFHRLQAIGRVPLLAQAKEPAAKLVPEPVSFKLGDRISVATVERLEALVKAGGRIYLEGAPFLDEKGQPAPWKLTALVGATATQVAPKPANLVLEDPWFFGNGRGESVRVVQTVSIVLGASSLAAVAKTAKGSFAPTGPRAVAKLEDGSPGVIVNPLGKGEVIWCPFEIGTVVAPVQSGAAPAPTSDGKSWRALFAGIADYLAPRLVQLKGPGAADDIVVSLRRSAQGTMIVGLRNTKPVEAVFSATVEGAFQSALCLNDETELKPAVRGGQTTVQLILPGGSMKLLAFSATRKTFDAERDAPRLKVKLR